MYEIVVVFWLLVVSMSCMCLLSATKKPLGIQVTIPASVTVASPKPVKVNSTKPHDTQCWNCNNGHDMTVIPFAREFKHYLCECGATTVPATKIKTKRNKKGGCGGILPSNGKNAEYRHGPALPYQSFKNLEKRLCPDCGDVMTYRITGPNDNQKIDMVCRCKVEVRVS